MAAGLYSWSQTDASNNSADSTITWAEGQGPASVNNSARSMMARIAEWRDDLAGVKPSNAEMVTGGSADAQTLSTNATIDPAALTHGWMVTFQAGFTNTTTCTLAVDSLTAKNIQSAAGTNVVAGEIVAGRYYTVHYNQPDDAWILHSGPGYVPSNVIATTAQVRANTSGKVIDTTGLWAAAATVALTDGASIAVDLSSGWNFTLTLTATGRTLANPSSAKVGQCGFIRVTSSGGNYTLNKGAGWLSTETFPITVNNGAVHYLFYSVYTTAPLVVITGILIDPA
jgi:hypothetical protein